MKTKTQRPFSLHVGEFSIESLGVEYPDYFQGFGLGPGCKYNHCAYGIGSTRAEALDDCLDMVAQQGFTVDDETESRIQAEYGPADDSETALEALGVEGEAEDLYEPPYFHIGIKWNCREEERFARICKINRFRHDLKFLRYENYGPQDPSSRRPGLQERSYTRRVGPDKTSVYYGDLETADRPESAVKYLEALSTDPQDEGELYFYLPCAIGSDYSGSTVEKSNYWAFLESYGNEDFVWPVYGCHGTYAVALGLTGLLECPDDTFDAILETIEGLEIYPVIDEEALFRLETERANKAWESWAAFDFRRALEGKFDGVEFRWPPDSDLRYFFEEMANKANEYWHNEDYGPDMYIRVDEIVKVVDFADVEKWVAG